MNILDLTPSIIATFLIKSHNNHPTDGFDRLILFMRCANSVSSANSMSSAGRSSESVKSLISLSSIGYSFAHNL